MYTVAERIEHLREVADLARVPVDEFVLPTEREVTGNGLQFHLLDWGTAGQPTVLFLHGGSLTAHTWDLVCLALRQRYHCLAYDLRGHGDTAWSPEADYSLEAHRTDLEAVVEQLGLQRFILVGMSLGGATSLSYAGKNADRLAGLVLVDIGPDGRAAGRRRIADFVETSPELESVEAFVEKAMAFNPLRRPEMLRRSLLHNLRETPRGTWTWKWDPQLRQVRTSEAQAHRRTVLWAAVPNVGCPALVVRGGNSDVLLDEDAEKLAAALPSGSWVRIEGAGHTVQGDQPRALVEALGPFFAAAAGSAS
jgi:pimeloyl-ACP methyl ester carboxylesterase